MRSLLYVHQRLHAKLGSKHARQRQNRVDNGYHTAGLLLQMHGTSLCCGSAVLHYTTPSSMLLQLSSFDWTCLRTLTIQKKPSGLFSARHSLKVLRLPENIS